MSTGAGPYPCGAAPAADAGSPPITATRQPEPAADAASDTASALTAPLADLVPRLRRTLRGEVRDDREVRALYASDASNYRVVPAAVVAPRDLDDLAAVVAMAAEAGVPLTMRGAGTSISGNAIGHGLIVDTSRHLAGVLALDPDPTGGTGTATVLPGTVLDDVNAAAARHGLRVGPDPSTHSRCTVGGMIGNDACGSHSVRWGTTAENLLGLEVITTDGVRRRVGALGEAAPAGSVALGPDARGPDRRSARRSRGPHPPRSAALAPARVGLPPGLAAAGTGLGRGPGTRRHRGHLRGGLRRHHPSRPGTGRPAPPRPRVPGRHRGRGRRPRPPPRAPVHRREPHGGLPGRMEGPRAPAGGRCVAAAGGRGRDHRRGPRPCRTARAAAVGTPASPGRTPT